MKPLVHCREEYEDTQHYFMECSNYADLRLQLLNAIAPYTYPDIGIILYGNHQLDQNKTSTESV